MLLSLSTIAFLSWMMPLAINVVVAQSQYSSNPFQTSLAQHEAKSPLKWCGKCYQEQDIGNPACELAEDTFFETTYPLDQLPKLRLTCTARLSAYEREDLDANIKIEVLVSTYSDREYQNELPLSIINHAGKTVFTGYTRFQARTLECPYQPHSSLVPLTRLHSNACCSPETIPHTQSSPMLRSRFFQSSRLVVRVE